METKQEMAKKFIGLFVNNEIPDKLIKCCINDKNGEPTLNLQNWIIYNMKLSISSWCTGIAIIESFELCYKEYLINGNII